MPIHSNMLIQQECVKKGYGTHTGICKHFVPHYWFTSFIPMSWIMPYTYHMVCWSMHSWHSSCTYIGTILQYIQHGIGLYTKVHFSLYNINIIARSGMHNIWVWKAQSCTSYYIMYNTHAVLRFVRIYLQLYNIIILNI